MPDKDVVRCTGRTPRAVLGRRASLRIPEADSKLPRWTPAEEKVLGTVPDRKLARQLQRPVRGVMSRRVRLRIMLPSHRWTPREDKLLGTKPDQAMAQRSGHTVVACLLRRRAYRESPIPGEGRRAAGVTFFDWPATAEPLFNCGTRSLLWLAFDRFERAVNENATCSVADSCVVPVL